MTEKFNTNEAIIEALKGQDIVNANEALAKELAGSGKIIHKAAGEDYIFQGSSDKNVYFILEGNTEVVVDGKIFSSKQAGSYVGEMSVLDNSDRGASVRATTESVMLEVAGDKFMSLADQNPNMWRVVAKALVTRLRKARGGH